MKDKRDELNPHFPSECYIHKNEHGKQFGKEAPNLLFLGSTSLWVTVHSELPIRLVPTKLSVIRD